MTEYILQVKEVTSINLKINEVKTVSGMSLFPLYCYKSGTACHIAFHVNGFTEAWWMG